MARSPKPRWDDDRKLWFANVGPPLPNGRASKFRFPREDPETGRPITEKDEPWAWKFLERVLAEQSMPAGPSSLAPTFGAILEEFLHALELRAEAEEITMHTRAVTESKLNRFAAHELPTGLKVGATTLDRLGTEELKQFFRGLRAEGYSLHYLDSIWNSINALCNWSAKRKGSPWPKNPFADWEVPTPPELPERYAERREAAAFLWYLRKRLREIPKFRRTKAGDSPELSKAWLFEKSFVLLERVIINSGCRPGEACCLMWGDLKEGGLSQAGHPYFKASIPPSRWKTGKKTGRFRTVYLTPILSRSIRRLKETSHRHPTHVFVHGRGRGGKGDGEPWKDGSVLSKRVAKMRREMLVEAKAAEARRSAGRALSPLDRLLLSAELHEDGPKRIVNYLWRHTAASNLIMLGIDLATVAELLGTSVEMLHKHYKHLLKEHLANAAETLASHRKGKKPREEGKKKKRPTTDPAASRPDPPAPPDPPQPSLSCDTDDEPEPSR